MELDCFFQQIDLKIESWVSWVYDFQDVSCM